MLGCVSGLELELQYTVLGYMLGDFADSVFRQEMRTVTACEVGHVHIEFML